MNASSPHRRVALVTGAARGIGRAIAIRLAADGHAVTVADIGDADETLRLIRDAGGRAEAYSCDVTSADALAALAAQVDADMGPVDVLVANAGIYPVASFFDTSWETWRKVMDINVDAVYHALQAFLPGMVDRRWGRVVVVASGAFYAPVPGFSAYIASKGAVIGLVRGVAQEVGASGVTVNCVAPSITPTPGVEAGPQREMGVFDLVLQAQAIKRIAEPEDAAKAVSFLVSDDGDFVTAQVLASDGGAISV